jgi:hypothetical protein
LGNLSSGYTMLVINITYFYASRNLVNTLSVLFALVLEYKMRAFLFQLSCKAMLHQDLTE